MFGGNSDNEDDVENKSNASHRPLDNDDENKSKKKKQTKNSKSKNAKYETRTSKRIIGCLEVLCTIFHVTNGDERWNECGWTQSELCKQPWSLWIANAFEREKKKQQQNWEQNEYKINNISSNKQ